MLGLKTAGLLHAVTSWQTLPFRNVRNEEKNQSQSPMLPTNYKVIRYSFAQISGSFAIDFGQT